MPRNVHRITLRGVFFRYFTREDEEDFRPEGFLLLSGWHCVQLHVCFSQIEEPFDLFLAHRWNVCDEFVDCISFSEMIE